MSQPGEGEGDVLVLPPSGPGSKRRRGWFLGVCGLLLLAVVVAFREVLLPFLLGLVLAYVLSPVVGLAQHALGRIKPPRWSVVLVLYATLIGMLVALVSLSGPRLAAELGRLSRDAPRAVATFRKQWLPEIDRRLREARAPYLAQPSGEAESRAVAPVKPPVRLPEPGAIEVRPRPGGGYQVLLPQGGLRVVPESNRAYRIEAGGRRGKTQGDLAAAITSAVARTMDNTEQTALALLQAAQQLITKLVRGIFGLLLTIVISAYLLITSDRVFVFARSLYPPERRVDFDELVRRIDRGLSGVVRGQLIICAINGVLSGIGFYLLGIKYWTFLTLLAAVMSIIPIFGSILSSIPAVLVALTQDFGLALLVLAWIVGIHQLEAHVLNPKIMGDSARVHPVLVVFALLAGEHAAGIVGALLAVPVLSIIQTLFLYLRERFLGVPRSSSMPPPAVEAPRPEPESVSTADPSRAH